MQKNQRSTTILSMFKPGVYICHFAPPPGKYDLAIRIL